MNSQAVARCLTSLTSFDEPPLATAVGAEGGRVAATAADGREAVVYIPGFNTSVRQALSRFGQMLALAGEGAAATTTGMSIALIK